MFLLLAYNILIKYPYLCSKPFSISLLGTSRFYYFSLLEFLFFFFLITNSFFLPASLSLTLFMSLFTHTHTHTHTHFWTACLDIFTDKFQVLASVAGLKSGHSLMSLPVQSEICNQYITETALERPLLYSSSLNPVESSQPMTILTMFFLKCSSAISSAPCTFIFPKLLRLLSKIQFFSIN